MILFNLQLFSCDFLFFVFDVIKDLMHFFSAFSLLRPIQKFSYHDNHPKRHTYGLKVWLSIAAKSINLYLPLYGLAYLSDNKFINFSARKIAVELSTSSKTLL